MESYRAWVCDKCFSELLLNLFKFEVSIFQLISWMFETGAIFNSYKLLVFNFCLPTLQVDIFHHFWVPALDLC